MKVLVTGGAGYIGSITASILKKQGVEVVVFDNLVKGHKNNIKGFELVTGDIKDTKLVRKTLKTKQIKAVLHFAAFIEMGESMKNPKKYIDNNLIGSQSLLEAMIETKVKKIIFSSTAGVYGNPEKTPIRENDRKMPQNPYGLSKLMVEQMLNWYDRIHGLKSIIIRYFNAAGASLDGRLGEDHQPESHLIPNMIKTMLKNREFNLFGDDYQTPDGTCVRDYIHVLDLAEVHILALKDLKENHKSNVYNAGTGQGYSNKQVIKMVEKISGRKLKVKVGPRRPGDADKLVADSNKLQKKFDWKPKYSDLETIIESAWKWHKQQYLKNNLN